MATTKHDLCQDLSQQQRSNRAFLPLCRLILICLIRFSAAHVSFCVCFYARCMSVCFLCSPANVQTSVFGKACQCDYLQTRGSLLGIYLYVSDGINHMLVAVVLCDTRLYLSLRGLT